MMPTRYMGFILAVAVAAPLSLAGCAGQDARLVKGENIQVRVLQDGAAMETAAALAERGDRVYRQLRTFFARDVPVPVTIKIDANARIARSFSARNAIVFPPRVVTGNNAIIAHEMTHLFMPENRSEALREGIAVYAQDRFGEVPGYPNYGNDLDQLVVKRLSDGIGKDVGTFSAAEALFRHNRGTDSGGKRVSLDKVDAEARRNAYLIAGSFVRYLFDDVLRSDMAAFKRLYTEGDYLRETGMMLAALEAGWQRHIGLK
ncbi:MAG: hypothetical protein JJ900_14510 [Rhodospirillales bacterium]|nr:hypothetical protein [Rhodospirillales bacterium]MBO6788056.1 hypothetical protein [Rhodospirillales bacterium]